MNSIKTFLVVVMATLAFGVVAKPNKIRKEEPTVGIQFFHGTFKEALAKAKKENKQVMMDCFTTWCGPCKFLKSKVFTDKALGEYMNKNFICVAMDYENGEGPAIAQMYPVDGYPTVILMDSGGKVKNRVVGVPQPFASAAAIFLAEAKKVAK
jgi:thioredoxin 1